MGLPKKVRRFDVATIMETAFEQHEWKGDAHHCGVFFTDTKGYCVNKVLAIRATHEEKAPQVFYSFFTKAIDEKVTKEYPYENMDKNPKKHHLLHTKPELTLRDMDHLFDIEEEQGFFTAATEEMCATIEEKIPNKRERDRAIANFELSKKEVAFALERNKKNVENELHKEILCTDELKWVPEKTSTVALNANTLHTVLRIFTGKTKVSFRVSHGKMKLTGCLSTEEGEEALVEVVLSLMKGLKN